MLERLLNLLSSVNTESLTKMLEHELTNINSMSFKTHQTTFVDKGDHYELALNVKEGATEDNVKVDFDGEIVTVWYKETTENSTMAIKVLEQIPEDADDSTLDASIVDNKLVVTVNKNSNINKEKKHIGVCRNQRHLLD